MLLLLLLGLYILLLLTGIGFFQGADKPFYEIKKNQVSEALERYASDTRK